MAKIEKIQFMLVLNGVLKTGGQWFEIGRMTVTDEDTLVRSEVDDLVEQFKQVIGTSYRDGKDGYITLRSTIINIQSFAALSFDVHEYQ